MSLLFTFLDALLGSPSIPSSSPKKKSFNDDVPWEEECFGCGEHQYARPEAVPAHTIFVITTDGMENASRKYTREKIKQMIERQKDQYGWEFIFLAANIDAAETAAEYGIEEERAVEYRQDSKGISCSYRMMSDAISRVRDEESLDDGEWKNGRH